MHAIEHIPGRPVAIDTFALGVGKAFGRPTLTVATCRATRTILGLALSPDPNPTTTAGKVAAPDGGPDGTQNPVDADHRWDRE